MGLCYWRLRLGYIKKTGGHSMLDYMIEYLLSNSGIDWKLTPWGNNYQIEEYFSLITKKEWERVLCLGNVVSVGFVSVGFVSEVSVGLVV